MNEIEKAVSKSVSFLQNKHHFTQKELAEKCGLATGTINKAVKEGKLSIKSALIMSQALDTSLDFIFGRIQEENVKNYAVDMMIKHFNLSKGKTHFEGSLPEAHIFISPALAEFLKTIARIQDEEMPKDLCEEWERRAKKSFSEAINDKVETQEEYVLIKAERYTHEAQEIVRAVKIINKQG